MILLVIGFVAGFVCALKRHEIRDFAVAAFDKVRSDLFDRAK